MGLSMLMTVPTKIKNPETLRDALASYRAENRKVVLCHGAFELLHLGTIRHLEQAKKMGDVLVVTVAAAVPNGSLASQPSYPSFSQNMRAEALAALNCVDCVVTNHALSAIEALQLVQPAVFVPSDLEPLGSEQEARAREAEEALCRAWGGRVERVVDSGLHSAGLLCHALPAIPAEARSFLSSFLARHRAEAVFDALVRARELRVLFVGEAIIDEYHYCESLGKSGKEPILAVRYLSEERFAGGILATANQAASVSDHVGLITLLGTQDSHEAFIREKLNPDVDAMFVYMPQTRTIVKRRLVEHYPLQKLFEVYLMDNEVPESAVSALYRRLKAILPNYDAVVVTDYGHGMLTPEVIELLCSQARFLAVNTQTNAANQGFNTIAKYPRADFICISEKELRLEARNRSKDLRLLAAEIADTKSCSRMLLTRGRDGNLCYEKGHGFHVIPPFATRIIDRVGAGDALLAVSSILAAAGEPMEVVGLVGNVVGAQAVETVGNRSIVTRSELLNHINSLLNYDAGA